MNFDDIQVGQWFEVSCEAEDQDFSGIGMVTWFNPTGYPANTFEVLCSDGEYGYFTAEEFTKKVPLPDAITLNTLLLFLSQNRS